MNAHDAYDEHEDDADFGPDDGLDESRDPVNPPEPGDDADARTDEGGPQVLDLVAELKPSQQRAILALLQEPSIAKAARAARVGNRTLHSWLDDPKFVTAFRRAKRHVFEQAISLTHRYTALAVNTLAKVMVDPAAPYAPRVTAAAAILRFSRDTIELEDLQERVELLERQSRRDLV
ncbi:MAG: hypothetical protein KF866_00115 [Phycisphaeraceae bacterium]|nr:hypothetical protein [Phycisphaeraceae bacterium]